MEGKYVPTTEGLHGVKKTPSPKQQRLAVNIAENLTHAVKPKGMTELALEAGFAPSTANNPGLITKAPGFRVAMHNLGLTEELITTALVDDIESKPGKRLGELRLGAELLGIVKREDVDKGDKPNNTYNFLFDSGTKEDVRMIEEKIKARLIQQSPHDQAP